MGFALIGHIWKRVWRAKALTHVVGFLRCYLQKHMEQIITILILGGFIGLIKYFYKYTQDTSAHKTNNQKSENNTRTHNWKKYLQIVLVITFLYALFQFLYVLLGILTV